MARPFEHPILTKPTLDPLFDEQVRKYAVRTISGAHCVRIVALQEWLKSKCEAGMTNTERILRMYDFRSMWYLVKPFLKEANDGNKNLLFLFTKLDFMDSRLPIPLGTLTQTLSEHEDKGGREVAEAFNRMQWHFRPAVLEVRNRYYLADWIIPFHKKKAVLMANGEEVHKGYSAKLYEVAVCAEFLSEEVRRRTMDSRRRHRDHGDCHVLVVKTFNPGHGKSYESEVKIHQALEHYEETSGFVRYLGSFEHRKFRLLEKDEDQDIKADNTTLSSCNILFEYADCDLDYFFKNSSPPFHKEGILKFWRDMLDVVDALKNLHNPPENRDRAACGWHADIKPDNILLIRNRFKLADVGFSKINLKKEPIPTLRIKGGTSTYNAPERHLNAPVSQKIDIWSLGCVFSIAATWIVLGPDYLADFDAVRKHAVQQSIRDRRSEHQSQKGGPARDQPPKGNPPVDFNVGNYFHDGINVLPEVVKWHDTLRLAQRRTDTTTHLMLDLVEKHMLLGNAEMRLTCEELHVKYRQILNAGSRLKAPEIPQSIQSILDRPDKPSQESETSSGMQIIKVAENMDNSRTHAVKRLRVKDQEREYRKSSMRSAQDSAEAPRPMLDIRVAAPTPSHQFRPSAPELTVAMPEVIASTADAPTKVPSDGSDVAEIQARRSSSWSKSRHHAEAWKLRKMSRPHFIARLIGTEDASLTKHYRNRDIVFVIDNSESMQAHWKEAFSLMARLLKKCEHVDKNGMDLVYTCQYHPYEDHKDILFLLGTMESKYFLPTSGNRTDMVAVLNWLFGRHMNRLNPTGGHKRSENPFERAVKNIVTGGRSSQVRDATVIILTDGIWSGTPRREAVDDAIVHFYTQLIEQIGWPRKRHFSIEFISFGNDFTALNHLQQLDDDLEHRNIPDMIDTEPSDGDLYKMLLGSLISEYDDMDLAERATVPQTPTDDPKERRSQGHFRTPSSGSAPRLSGGPSPTIRGKSPAVSASHTPHTSGSSLEQLPSGRDDWSASPSIRRRQ